MTVNRLFVFWLIFFWLYIQKILYPSPKGLEIVIPRDRLLAVQFLVFINKKYNNDKVPYFFFLLFSSSKRA